jgi:hypothetical protein
MNGRHSSDGDTAAADERETTFGSQKIMLDDNNLSCLEEENFFGSGLTSVFAP